MDQPLGPRVSGEAARAPVRRPLEGASLELRPLDPERDAEALYKASHGDGARRALWTYMGYGPFADRAAMRAWLERCAAADDPLFFAVVDRRTGSAFGMASFLRAAPADRVVEIGHLWYAPDRQRTRANTEAVYLLLAEAFDGLGNRRVEWKCDALNLSSRRAAERLGFVFEGVFRQHMIVKGRSRDTAWYSLLDREWPAARRALEAWLGSDGSRPLASLRGGD